MKAINLGVSSTAFLLPFIVFILALLLVQAYMLYVYRSSIQQINAVTTYNQKLQTSILKLRNNTSYDINLQDIVHQTSYVTKRMDTYTDMLTSLQNSHLIQDKVIRSRANSIALFITIIRKWHRDINTYSEVLALSKRNSSNSGEFVIALYKLRTTMSMLSNLFSTFSKSMNSAIPLLALNYHDSSFAIILVLILSNLLYCLGLVFFIMPRQKSISNALHASMRALQNSEVIEPIRYQDAQALFMLTRYVNIAVMNTNRLIEQKDKLRMRVQKLFSVYSHNVQDLKAFFNTFIKRVNTAHEHNVLHKQEIPVFNNCLHDLESTVANRQEALRMVETYIKNSLALGRKEKEYFTLLRNSHMQNHILHDKHQKSLLELARIIDYFSKHTRELTEVTTQVDHVGQSMLSTLEHLTILNANSSVNKTGSAVATQNSGEVHNKLDVLSKNVLSIVQNNNTIAQQLSHFLSSCQEYTQSGELLREESTYEIQEIMTQENAYANSFSETVQEHDKIHKNLYAAWRSLIVYMQQIQETVHTITHSAGSIQEAQEKLSVTITALEKNNEHISYSLESINRQVCTIVEQVTQED